MRKDHLRDYATSAFAFYSSVGGLKRYQEAKFNEFLFTHEQQEIAAGSGPSDAVAAANIRAEREMESDEVKAAVADLQAVESTLDFIRWLSYGREMRKALELVYFKISPDELGGDVIGGLVKSASLSIPASISSVYGWLGNARAIFAKHRGIRLSEREKRILYRLHM